MLHQLRKCHDDNYKMDFQKRWWTNFVAQSFQYGADLVCSDGTKATKEKSENIEVSWTVLAEIRESMQHLVYFQQCHIRLRMSWIWWKYVDICQEKLLLNSLTCYRHSEMNKKTYELCPGIDSTMFTTHEVWPHDMYSSPTVQHTSAWSCYRCFWSSLHLFSKFVLFVRTIRNFEHKRCVEALLQVHESEIAKQIFSKVVSKCYSPNDSMDSEYSRIQVAFL